MLSSSADSACYAVRLAYLPFAIGKPQTIELAADAIRGHRSAHSLATGPVMAEPAQQLLV